MENKPTDEKKPRRTKEKDVKEKVEKEKVEEKKPRRTKENEKHQVEDKKLSRMKDKDVKEKEKDEEKPRRTKEKDVKEKEKDEEKPRRTKEKDEKEKEKDDEKPRRTKDKDVKEKEKEKEKDEEKKPRRTKEKDEKEKDEEKKPSRMKEKDVKEKEKEKEKERDADEDVEYPFLDMPYLINHTRNYDSLKVCLKMTRKGVGLFARTPIKKGNTVAYYKVKVISERSTKYKKVKDGIYTFSIYTKDDEKIKKYFGDICMESLENPRRGAPFFGYLANEPSNGQSCNVSVDTNLKDNYIDREEVRPGDFFLYKLVALRDIPENEEICWYYGDHYDRDYEISDRTR